MRIISGKLRGKRLPAPKNLPVRPTTDMAKEALFNILANYFDFEGITVLDLFAGTGNISYEFASRGAKRVTAVDSDGLCTKYIAKTAEVLKAEFEISVIRADAFRYTEGAKQAATIVFADPPYFFKQEQYNRLAENIFENGFVEDGGILVIEHSKDIDFEQNPFFRFERKYGSVHFTFLGQSPL